MTDTVKKGELIVGQKSQIDTFNFFNPAHLETMQRVCLMFANSELVPDIYKISADNPKEKAISNCMVALEISQRIGASPLMIMQNMVPIYGRPAWSSKFLIATVNTCGRFNPIQYRFTNLGKVGKVKYVDYEWQSVNGRNKKMPVEKSFDGTNIDNWECIAFTTAKGSNTDLESSPITIELAIKEGWYTKNGSKWKTMTRQMLIYRAASFWTSAYAPELSMGMKTVEEVHDIEDIDFEDVSDRVKQEIKLKANSGKINIDNHPNQESEPINFVDEAEVAATAGSEDSDGPGF